MYSYTVTQHVKHRILFFYLTQCSVQYAKVSSVLYADSFLHISRSEKTGHLTDLKTYKITLYPSLLT